MLLLCPLYAIGKTDTNKDTFQGRIALSGDGSTSAYQCFRIFFSMKINYCFIALVQLTYPSVVLFWHIHPSYVSKCDTCLRSAERVSGTLLYVSVWIICTQHVGCSWELVLFTVHDLAMPILLYGPDNVKQSFHHWTNFSKICYQYKSFKLLWFRLQGGYVVINIGICYLRITVKKKSHLTLKYM